MALTEAERSKRYRDRKKQDRDARTVTIMEDEQDRDTADRHDHDEELTGFWATVDVNEPLDIQLTIPPQYREQIRKPALF